MSTKVGWFTTLLDDSDVDIYTIQIPPSNLKSEMMNSSPVSRCPAVQKAYENKFIVSAPFDIILRSDGGTITGLPDGVSFEDYTKFISHTPSDIRFDNKPIVQIDLRLAFVADEKNTTIRLTPPYMHHTDWPGVLISGEYDIYNWPGRPMNFAFEFHKTNEDLVIKRGSPIAYVEFNKKVKLVECELTDTLKRLTTATSSSNRITKGLKPIMKMFGQRRPKKLIKEID